MLDFVISFFDLLSLIFFLQYIIYNFEPSKCVFLSISSLMFGILCVACSVVGIC